MKNLLLVFFVFIFIGSFNSFAFADEFDSGDLWDNWNSNDILQQQTKNVSDEEFDKTIDKLQEKKNKKIRKKFVPKGEEFHQSNETEIINEEADKESLPVICLPVDIEVDGGILPVGHYQVKGVKDYNGNVYIELYQAHFIMAKFPAVETDEDFDEDTLTFAKWVNESDSKIKIIFGSLDLNAYAIIDIK